MPKATHQGRRNPRTPDSLLSATAGTLGCHYHSWGHSPDQPVSEKPPQDTLASTVIQRALLWSLNILMSFICLATFYKDSGTLNGQSRDRERGKGLTDFSLSSRAGENDSNRSQVLCAPDILLGARDISQQC